VRRVSADIDALREVLAFAFEASLMAGQAQQTVTARRRLHDAAAEKCFIARSVTFRVEHEPTFEIASA
jgi:organic hydroperoxide reductase OsmC/OhrA